MNPLIHVAVLLRPYIDLLLAGRKSVECRLTQQDRDPFQRIEPGERIYFKQSAGPYAATAVVEHVIFDSNLRPRDVDRLRRDYDHLICGNAEFWRRKRDSRYGTLIWLKEVVPSATGPLLPPLQGVAWVCLPEEPAWRRHDERQLTAYAPPVAQPNEPFSIEVTKGNLKNNTLYATRVIDRFPLNAIGGARRDQAGAPITLALHQGPTVETDIVGPRKLLRTRIWGGWFERHGVRAGDRVVFTPAGDRMFVVGLARSRPS